MRQHRGSTRQYRGSTGLNANGCWVGGALVILLSTGALAFQCRMDPDASHNACGLPYQLSNFQGMYKCPESVLVGRPKSVADIEAIVKGFDHIQPSGIGHSWWGDAFCPRDEDGAVGIVMTEMSNLEPFYRLGSGGGERPAVVVDEETMTVEVEAGLTQRQLLDFLAEYRSDVSSGGYTLPAFSWFIDQTMGGAVATNTHGSSLRHGSLSEQVVALEVVSGDGEARWYTEEDGHLFRALKVSVGRLGIITRLRMRIAPQQAVKRTLEEMNFAQFAQQVKTVQDAYRAAQATGSEPLVVSVLELLNETQIMWGVPQDAVWRVDFERLDKEPPLALLNHVEDLNAQDQALAVALFQGDPDFQTKSDGDDVLPIYVQDTTHTRVAPNRLMLFNPVRLSRMIMTGLRPNVTPGTYARNKAYLSMSETGTATHSVATAYDQYEVAIPLERAGDCLLRFSEEVYGSRALWRGFRTPPLIRFVSHEDAYLSLTHDGPAMYINLEDYVSYQGGGRNDEFIDAVKFLKNECGGRMHWGKAGWEPEHGVNLCFDGQQEFGDNWCRFGCAVEMLDPRGKFRSDADIWQFKASEGGESVPFASCCDENGFDFAKCQCMPAPRPSCPALSG